MIQQYRLVGRLPVPCNPMEWAEAFQQQDRHVALTEVGCIRISTVFLGLDHRFGEGPPLLFETMIFGDDCDAWQERCSTWDEAEQQHARAVSVAVEWVRKADAAARSASSQSPDAERA